jgi:hypothetical protein
MNKKKPRRLSIEDARIARKASYWQQKYDDWKKFGTVCPSISLSNLITDDLLQGYMDKGWNKITEIYNKKIASNDTSLSSPKSKVNHEFETKPIEQQELILEILGSIRKYIIQTTFRYVEKSLNGNYLNEILAVGTNNITSDYDVTILGPNANDIMWNMFISFLAKYQDALPEAFDSNLYSSPLYIHTSNIYHQEIKCKSKKILPQRVDYNERFFTLVPYTDEDLEIELNWACIKLLNIENKITKKLKKYINKAKKYKLFLDNLSKETDNDTYFRDVSLQNNLHPNSAIKKDTINVIKNYYLQWTWQKKLQKFIYSSDNEEDNFIKNKVYIEDNKYETNIFFYSNIPNYFSSEAYYTSSAVNCIVINEQIKSQLNLDNRSEKIKKGVNIVAAIENFGDLIDHLHKSYNEIILENINLENGIVINLIKTIIIKYSKYFYRIFKVLSKAGNNDIIELTDNIKKKVIPYRKTYDIKKATENNIFQYLFYENELDFLLYISKIENIILVEIEKVL